MEVQIPVDEDELLDFRQRWRAEVLTSSTAPNASISRTTAKLKDPVSPPKQQEKSSVPLAESMESGNSALQSERRSANALAPDERLEKALEAYTAATKYERMGNLSAAIASYRTATKLDPNVEQHFRKVISQSSHPIHTQHDEHEPFYTYYDFHHQTSNHQTTDMDALVQQFENVAFTLQSPNRRKAFGCLPYELISQIISWALLAHGHDVLCALTLVSRKMLVLCKEQSVWRFLCEKVHKPSVDFISLTEELKLYKDNWFDMWLDKPRLRRNGVFISRVNYIRQGQAESFYAPVHLVTYYRYMRFLPDRVLCWTTTIEPAAAVKSLSEDMKQKGLMVGDYVLCGKTVHLHMRGHDRPGVSFKATLSLSQSRRGKHNKLSWVAYWQERDAEPNYRSDIPTKTLRTFYFSRVKSYPQRLVQVQ